MKRTTLSTITGFGLFALLSACSPATNNGPRGGNTGNGGNGEPTGPVTSSGVAVSESANQKFTQAAALMRQHDDANNGFGDWTEDSCNQVQHAFEDAAHAQPQDQFPEAWFNRALVFDRCGKAAEAQQALQTAIDKAKDHKYCRARVQQGVFQLRANQRDAALATFNKAIEEDQNCLEGYVNLATMLRERGQGEDLRNARVNIRLALIRDDRFLPALNQLALAYMTEAGDDTRSGALMSAGLVCNQAVQIANSANTAASTDASKALTGEVKSYLADIYNTWGLVAVKLGQITAALARFQEAARLNPKLFEAHVNFGAINLGFRGYEDARNSFQQAVALRPNDYDAHINLGVALRGIAAEKVGKAFADEIKSQRNEALADNEEAIAGDETDPAKKQQRLDRAAQLKEEAAKLKAEAQQLLADGNPMLDQAKAEYEKAKQLDANRPEAYFNLALLNQNYINLLGEGSRTNELTTANSLYTEFLTRAGADPKYAANVETARRNMRINEETIHPPPDQPGTRRRGRR